MTDLQTKINAIQPGWYVSKLTDEDFVLFPIRSDGTMGAMSAVGSRDDLIYFVKKQAGKS